MASVKVDFEGGNNGVAVINMCNPPVNALVVIPIIRGLKERFDEAARRNDVKVKVLTGKDEKFFGGFDISVMQKAHQTVVGRLKTKMGMGNLEAIKQLQSLVENVDEKQKISFQNMHQGYPTETLGRFLKARDWNVAKAHKMLIDCLHWRVENEIDKVLQKPIQADLYEAVRDSQLIGMSGYSKEGIPVIAVGCGLSTYDKASDKYYIQSHIQINEYRDRVILPTATKKHGHYIGTCVKVLDMTGLKFSALNQLRLLTAISTVDDLNYPEKTDTYYIVNAPYVFSACWKVVKPLLQERTRKKIQVLKGCGKEELLKVMDYASLPHFSRKESSRSSSRHNETVTTENCFSFNHVFHQQLYNHIKHQAMIMESRSPIRQGSFYIEIPEPDPDDAKIANTIEVEFHKLENHQNFTNSLNNGFAVNGH